MLFRSKTFLALFFLCILILTLLWQYIFDVVLIVINIFVIVQIQMRYCIVDNRFEGEIIFQILQKGFNSLLLETFLIPLFPLTQS